MMKLIQRAARYLLFWCTAALVLAACGNKDTAQLTTFNGETMGTTYSVKYWSSNKQSLPEPAKVQAQMDALLVEVNRQMSTYQPDSEISRFNQMPASADSMPISADFAEVVTEAIHLNQFTEGALDVTVGPLVNLWGFGPDKTITHSPDVAQLAAAKKIIGIDKLRFQPNSSGATLGKTVDGVYLDLSSIAKGFAVDKLARHLDSLGVANYLVEIGGELRAKGRNTKQQPWNVGIEQPQLVQAQATQIVVPLDNRALATSGDYRNFHSDESGRRLSHIIDPKSELPINHNLASVSVVADNTMRADGLATGLFVLGEERAIALAKQHNLAIFLIAKTQDGFTTHMSPAFEQLLANHGH